MKVIQRATQGGSLEGVAERFRVWRANRNGEHRIPEELWKAAVDLTREHPMARVSRILRVDYNKLRELVERSSGKKIRPSEPKFVEMRVAPEILRAAGCVLELEDGKGRRLKIGLERAETGQILEWANGFWQKED